MIVIKKQFSVMLFIVIFGIYILKLSASRVR